MKVWLEKGWIRWLPTTLPAGMNFIGLQGGRGKRGGFRRIVAVEDHRPIITASRDRVFRLDYVPGDFEATCTLTPLRPEEK